MSRSPNSEGIALVVEAKDEIVAWGDRDLLLEAISNRSTTP